MAPGQQPDHGVDDDERGQLAAGQHVVADRQLEVDQRADPLVDALVARAHEDEMRSRGEIRRARLAEDLADRIEQDHGRVRRGAARRARRPPARAAGSSPLPRRTARRPPSGAGRCPTRAGRGCGPWRGPAPGSGPGCSAASGPSNIAGKSVRTSMSRVMRPCPARAARLDRRARRLGGLGGSAGLGSPPAPPRRPSSVASAGAAPSAGRGPAPAIVAAAGRATRRRRRSRHVAARRPG